MAEAMTINPRNYHSESEFSFAIENKQSSKFKC